MQQGAPAASWWPRTPWSEVSAERETTRRDVVLTLWVLWPTPRQQERLWGGENQGSLHKQWKQSWSHILRLCTPAQARALWACSGTQWPTITPSGLLMPKAPAPQVPPTGRRSRQQACWLGWCLGWTLDMPTTCIARPCYRDMLHDPTQVIWELDAGSHLCANFSINQEHRHLSSLLLMSLIYQL